MKRKHRKAHFLLWLVLGPAIAAILLLAVTERPASPVNDNLPNTLIEGAR